MLGRRMNLALWDEVAAARVLADVAPLFEAADIALVNAEGVISLGGSPWDKGEPRPHQHHAAPAAIDVLTRAGVDVVTLGNNHAGDYGPWALREMTDRLRLAGIDYAGAGLDAADARRPAYRRVGDVVVAIVGAELTLAKGHSATRDRPGIFHLEGMAASRKDEVVQALLAVEAEARAHAQVVILSPHWGENFKTAPTELTRSIAHALIDGGYDAILGHSSHFPQGVELYQGRPIAYDAGDLAMDYGGDDEAHQGLIYDLRFTRAGVTGLEVRPIFLRTNETSLADTKWSKVILGNWQTRSAALDTTVEVQGGVGSLRCDPGGASGPERVTDPPERPLPPALRLAPDETLLDALPATATAADLRWPSLGLRLVGHELTLHRLRIPKAGNLIRAYFVADQALPEGLMIRIDTAGRSTGEIDDHIPGDWMLPGPRWPVGRIVQDRTLLRLVGAPEGTVTFRLGVLLNGALVPAEGSTLPIEGGMAVLGAAPYEVDAPGLFKVFAADPRSAF